MNKKTKPTTPKKTADETNKEKNYDYTSNERKGRQRAELKAMGITRRETNAHDDDWPAIKLYADKKRDKRIKEYEAANKK
ncbi:MAG: hypothetical protein ACJAS1_000537 [Oleiphilaceae bacterium]|jgi:hypothetical protein